MTSGAFFCLFVAYVVCLCNSNIQQEEETRKECDLRALYHYLIVCHYFKATSPRYCGICRRANVMRGMPENGRGPARRDKPWRGATCDVWEAENRRLYVLHVALLRARFVSSLVYSEVHSSETSLTNW